MAEGHLAGMLAAERRAAPPVWNLSASSSTYVAVFKAKCKELHRLDFPQEILQGAGAN
jgi:hypothetical protein